MHDLRAAAAWHLAHADTLLQLADNLERGDPLTRGIAGAVRVEHDLDGDARLLRRTLGGDWRRCDLRHFILG